MWRQTVDKDVIRPGTVIIVLFLVSLTVQAQHRSLQDIPDNEFLQILASRNDPPVREGFTIATEQPIDRKCSFNLMAEAARRLPSMNPTDAQTLHSLLAQPKTHTSILSHNGRFRIYFDTTGRHTPAMIDQAGERIPDSHYEYADSVAAIFEYVYDVEIGRLGYEPPPLYEGVNEYQVYIQEYYGGYYGETQWFSSMPNTGTLKNTYPSYIMIDNDYREFYSKGLDGLRVTAAHEYHHAIQLGRYGLWSEDVWMHEMTSTYYEEYVFPEVNDYLIYVRTFMKSTDRSFYAWGNQGYELVLWPIMLEKFYGPGLMREFWNNLKRREPLGSMLAGLADVGGDFAEDFCSWAKNNYFTGWRWDRLNPLVYDDGEIYPSVVFSATQPVNAGNASFSGVIQPLASRYYRVARGLDTVAFVVCNVDMSAALARSQSGVGFGLEIVENAPDDSWKVLSNGWAYKFNAETENALCIQVLDAGIELDESERSPWPNPLLLTESTRMHFPLPRQITANRVDFVVYSVGMKEVYRKGNMPVTLDGINGAYLEWDLLHEGDVAPPSGVYFYFLSYEGGQHSGKFAIIGK